jgi:hypothetical protein
MKLKNPWIDPRVALVKSADAQAYLARLGWHLAGPGANPSLLLYDPPPDCEDAPTFMVPLHDDQGPSLQWMIDLVGELAVYQHRYAGDVLTDILAQTASARTNGIGPDPQRDAEAATK